MPDKRFRPRRLPRTERKDSKAGVLKMARTAAPQPAEAMTLRLISHADAGPERWELVCRDGWDWQPAPAQSNGAANGSAGGGPGTVWVRSAILNAEQAAVVRHWLERIGDPATWWAVSRALQTPESAPNVAAALRDHPWLNAVLPVVLEASTNGAPPPPPANRPQ